MHSNVIHENGKIRKIQCMLYELQTIIIVLIILKNTTPFIDYDTF